MTINSVSRGDDAVPWLFISEGKCEPERNMTRDTEIYNLIISGNYSGGVRFYNWDNPAVTTGHHQKGFSPYDETLNIPVLVRPTGGGAVLHDDDVTFCISSKAGGVFNNGILATYRAVSEIFLEAFISCGIDAEISLSEGSFSDICFERTSKLELKCQGQKIMGAAQARRKGSFLLQGVIPLKVDDKLYKRVFGPSFDSPAGLLDMGKDFSCEKFISIVRRLLADFIGDKCVFFDA